MPEQPDYGRPLGPELRADIRASETNSYLRGMVERLDRQEERLADAERHSRLMMWVAVASLMAAVVAAVAAIIAIA